MQVPFFQVDAFTSAPYRGNPAAVCLLPSWPSDDVLHAVAAENNLSEVEAARCQLRRRTPFLGTRSRNV